MAAVNAARVYRRRIRSRAQVALYVVAILSALAYDLYVADHFANDEPDDGRLYSQIARNLIQHGAFSAEAAEPFVSTIIRLPGYPIFLAGSYWAFGDGNDRAVRLVQGGLHFLTAIIAATLAWYWCAGSRRRRRKGWLIGFILTAFCPFTVVYSATILTEVLTMLFLAIGALTVTVALDAKGRSALFWWAASGVYFGTSVLIRPDGGLFALSAGLTLLAAYLLGMRKPRAFFRTIVEGLVFTAAFMLMLIPWTVRNERVFGVFQPLAPTHAEAPGEFVPEGYFLWVRTWIDDPRYIGPMLWDLEEKPINIESVPASAFDSSEEKQRVAGLLDQYDHSWPVDESPSNDSSDDAQDTGASDSSDGPDDTANDAADEQDLSISPDVDAGFREIANERIERDPLRYYFELPVKRSVAMWFDTHSQYYPFDGELFPLTDLDPGSYQHIWLPIFAGFVWLYTVAAAIGLFFLVLSRDRRGKVFAFMALSVCLPRIIYFSTLENPEPRYFVELFVVAAVLGAVALSRLRLRCKDGFTGIEFRYRLRS